MTYAEQKRAELADGQREIERLARAWRELREARRAGEGECQSCGVAVPAGVRRCGGTGNISPDPCAYGE